ncbi:glycosyltransferase [Anaerolineales bacterium HSG6]|nr:glycosyltransferase [Anaerolineales bacterium HSG6]MDM8531049.1 glycosyltransferase [Anaerolineales bacterium HSG25]
MKIALVGPTYPFRGGIAHYTTLLYKALVKQHTVMFYSFKRQYPSWLFPGQTDRDNSRQPLYGECRYTIDSLNPLTWRDTAKQIDQFQPDILLLSWWHPYWALVWFYLMHRAKRQQVSILYIVHNVVSHETKWWDKWLTKSVLSSANKLIVHSNEERQRLLTLLPSATVQVVPLPTYTPLSEQSQPLSQTEARQQLSLSDTERVLLFFGFVRPYKGLPILLEALVELTPSLPVRLLIVGEFWKSAQETEQFLIDHQLTTHVTIINRYIPNEAIGIYFSAADVVVLPYRRASGSAVLQLAFGFGKPVIASDVGGLNDVVADGETGLLVPPNDSVALAQTIERFYQTNQAWSDKIKSYNQQFSWQHLVEQVTKIPV